MFHLHGGNVSLRKRDYDPETYTCHKVYCSHAGYMKAKNIACQRAQNNTEFSQMSLLQSYFKIPLSSSKTTCCSQLTAEILNAACDFDLDPKKCTPSSIATFLKAQNGLSNNHSENEVKTAVKDGSSIVPLDFKINLKV